MNYADIGNALIKQFHIAKNSHGVFFDNNTQNVLQIEDILREVVSKYSLRIHDMKEIISYIDVMCDRCELGSVYFRKGKLSYGIRKGERNESV